MTPCIPVPSPLPPKGSPENSFARHFSDQFRRRTLFHSGTGRRELVERYLRDRFVSPASQRQCSGPALWRAFGIGSDSGWASGTRRNPWCECSRPGTETVYWVGAAGVAQDAGRERIFMLSRRARFRYATQIDLTHVSQLSVVRDWIR